MEKLRKNRLERVREIKESKRKRKTASDIEDGEVDSEGKVLSLLEACFDLISLTFHENSNHGREN